MYKIEIHLNNGEVITSDWMNRDLDKFLCAMDRMDTVGFICKRRCIVIPKHSISYYVEITEEDDKWIKMSLISLKKT